MYPTRIGSFRIFRDLSDFDLTYGGNFIENFAGLAKDNKIRSSVMSDEFLGFYFLFPC